MKRQNPLQKAYRRIETEGRKHSLCIYSATAMALEAQKYMISRQAVLDALNNIEIPRNASWYQYYQQALTAVDKLPPAQPEHPGKCKWCERLKERNLRIEYYWIDQEGCTASFSEPHIVATGIANFCPNCGAKMEVEDELQKTSNDE